MFKLVQEALAERAHLLAAAPFMAHPLPIIIPVYTWRELPYMWAGAKAYDLVASLSRPSPTLPNPVPESYYISREEAMFQFPMLDSKGLKGTTAARAKRNAVSSRVAVIAVHTANSLPQKSTNTHKHARYLQAVLYTTTGSIMTRG